ncbi:EnvZ/OmpR regulon moderator MzrA [Edwardsiella tarda]
MSQAYQPPCISRWGWKRLLGLLLFIVAALAAVILPQLSHKEVSLQIRATHSGLATPDGFFVYQKLDENGIDIASITPDRDGLVVRLARPEQHTLALQVLLRELPPATASPTRSYIVRYFIRVSELVRHSPTVVATTIDTEVGRFSVPPPIPPLYAPLQHPLA